MLCHLTLALVTRCRGRADEGDGLEGRCLNRGVQTIAMKALFRTTNQLRATDKTQNNGYNKLQPL
jgi:hypothetical protein